MINIRKMMADDAKIVANISSKCLEEAWKEQDITDSLEKEYTLLKVAENDSVVIGYVVFYISIDQAELESIAILPDQRAKGIASMLLEDAMKEVYEKGARSITLEVRESNTAARKLYEKFDFETWGKRKRFYRNPQEDALIMGKNF